jgi:exodeoxyribonuclease VII small subunit
MSTSPPASETISFEHALAELERVVHALEDGQTCLEDALAQYERGVGLLKRCYSELQRVEQRILLLSGQDAAGQPMTRPFEHAASLDSASGAHGPRTPAARKGTEAELPGEGRGSSLAGASGSA